MTYAAISACRLVDFWTLISFLLLVLGLKIWLQYAPISILCHKSEGLRLYKL